MLCSTAEPCPLFRQKPIKQDNLILLGPILLKAISKNEKGSLYEGHGFSRAVNGLSA
jgi:hypothetical protein